VGGNACRLLAGLAAFAGESIKHITDKSQRERLMKDKKVCVYCASSRQLHPDFFRAAQSVGRLLAENNLTIFYGGGSVGSMGHLADGALRAGGKVIGVIPRFMYELEWGHKGLTEMRIAENLHERKRWMLEGADAAIALPGGCGTLEELFEAITWKRLGIFLNPIIIVNTRGFFDPCVRLLEACIQERFMDKRHRAIWTVVDGPEDILEGIHNAPPWDVEARNYSVP
jgi:uncharacterized protein (TIGR00730 family)